MYRVETIVASFLEGEQVPSNSTTVIEGVMRDWEMTAGLSSPSISTVHGSRDHSPQSNLTSSGAIQAPSPDPAERPRLALTTSMSLKDDIDITTSVLQLSPNVSPRFPKPGSVPTLKYLRRPSSQHPLFHPTPLPGSSLRLTIFWRNLNLKESFLKPS